MRLPSADRITLFSTGSRSRWPVFLFMTNEIEILQSLHAQGAQVIGLLRIIGPALYLQLGALLALAYWFNRKGHS